jgi:hypothetical protein
MVDGEVVESAGILVKLKIEPTGFLARLDKGLVRETIKDNAEAFILVSWMDGE